MRARPPSPSLDIVLHFYLRASERASEQELLTCSLAYLFDLLRNTAMKINDYLRASEIATCSQARARAFMIQIALVAQ